MSRVTILAAGAFAIAHDLIQLAAMTSDVQPADVDPLTGLSMGARLNAFTLASWESATAACGALSVVLVELDDFDRYCDSYGAQAGEQLLCRASAVIRGSGVKPTDRAGRLAGAEFLLILPGASLDAAHIPAERILRAMRNLEIPNRGSTVANHVTVSIGAASCRPQRGDSVVTLIDAGGSALWSAKRRGHNRIAAYDLSPMVAAEEAVTDARHVG